MKETYVLEIARSKSVVVLMSSLWTSGWSLYEQDAELDGPQA